MEENLEKLNKLLDKRNRLYFKGGNDEKLNSKIRILQKQIRETNEYKTIN
jgi:hypothetical protein